MKRIGTVLLIVLCLAVIIGGAFLPRYVFSWQDSAAEKPGYAPISEVSLEVGNKNASSIRAKLALLDGAQRSMELPASLASLSERQVDTIIRNLINTCQGAGLLPGLSQTLTRGQIHTQPYLVRWSDSESQGSIFWHVNVELDPSYGRTLFLILDDETGTVCLMEYNDSSWDPDSPAVSQIHRLEALCRIYLEGLGSEFSQYDPAALVKTAYTPTEGDSLATTLSWADILYGEVTLQFTASPAYLQAGFGAGGGADLFSQDGA